MLPWLNSYAVAQHDKMPGGDMQPGDFRENLQMVPSMLAVVLGERSDGKVSRAQRAIAYAITHPETPVLFNWADCISRAIAAPFRQLDNSSTFTYVSHTVRLMIARNPPSRG